MYMYCNFRVFINISKYLLKSVTFLATTIFIVIHKHAGNIVQPVSEIAQLLTGSIYPTNHRERRRQL